MEVTLPIGATTVRFGVRRARRWRSIGRVTVRSVAHGWLDRQWSWGWFRLSVMR